jgi:DNA-binding PadR family transcriptional regulator
MKKIYTTFRHMKINSAEAGKSPKLDMWRTAIYLLDMSKAVSKGSRTRFLILGLLSEGPMSGYDIVHVTRLRFRFFWSESYGQIYPGLRKLEAEGLVAAGPEPGARGKKSWSISASGRKALEAWLEEPGANDSLRMETLLKAYFAHNAGPQSLASILGGFQARLAGDIKTLETMEAQLRELPDPRRNHEYAFMTAELGIATCRLWSDWAGRWISKEMKRKGK